MGNSSALRTFSLGQKLFPVILLALFTSIAIAFGPGVALTILVALLSVLYFTDMLFNFYLVLSSLRNSDEFSIEQTDLEVEREWPTYTVFCPLYKEESVLEQFTDAMAALDYPKDKLTIQLLLEEDDTNTIEAAQAMNLPNYFDIIVVPDSQPKTKPKACNVGLELTTSDYCVIFDAEDIPEPDQLKKAVLAFEQAPGDMACIQAKLNFYNPRQNFITRMFTAEYSMWFNLTLVGLQNIRGPIPLGGTSNHFRTSVLKGLRGWDPYNVTEDCDLGIRLFNRGYRTGILDAYTYEEANSKFFNWLRQRSRWIKGYMQTFLVHSRDLRNVRRSRFDPHVITFFLVVGGKILSMLINPFMWMMTILYFTARSTFGAAIESVYPAGVFYIAIATLIFGNMMYLYNYMLGAAQKGHWDLIKYMAFLPLYWLMMSAAAALALYQLIVKPHYWEKTVHGLHLKDTNGTAMPITVASSTSSGILSSSSEGSTQ